MFRGGVRKIRIIDRDHPWIPASRILLGYCRVTISRLALGKEIVPAEISVVESAGTFVNFVWVIWYTAWSVDGLGKLRFL